MFGSMFSIHYSDPTMEKNYFFFPYMHRLTSSVRIICVPKKPVEKESEESQTYLVTGDSSDLVCVEHIFIWDYIRGNICVTSQSINQ